MEHENLYFGRLNLLKEPLFYAGFILIALTFFDFFLPKFFSVTSFFRIDAEYKENAYLFLHLLFVIAIFVFQEINQKSTFKKLNENIIHLSPLKKIEEINSTVKKWLEEDQTNILIFYFPYSIHPGFWYDTGVAFSNFIDNLKNEINQSYKSKLYFIGPDIENSPFSKSIEALEVQLTAKFVQDYISGNKNFFNRFNFDQFEDSKKKEWTDKIKSEYKRKLEALLEHAKDKSNNFKVCKIGTDALCSINSSDCLPSFSFILKVNKNKAEDMIVIDTFNIISENNLNGFVNDLGIDSIWKSGELQKLLTPPQLRILNNQHTANLFFTTFLETCCNSTRFKELRTDLEKLN